MFSVILGDRKQKGRVRRLESVSQSGFLCVIKFYPIENSDWESAKSDGNGLLYKVTFMNAFKGC